MPRRIALFTGNYNHIADGVSLTLNRLVAYLQQQGVEVRVFAPTVQSPPVKHNGKLLEVPSIAAPGRPEYRVALFFPLHLRQYLLAFNPDIVHIATPDILGLHALLTARRSGYPVVSSFHTNFASYLKYYRLGMLEPLLWQYLRWYYRSCQQLLVPTESMKQELINHRVETEFGIWARGVETDTFHPEKSNPEWRRALGIQSDDIVLLFVSRLVWEKNLEAVIEVFSAYQESEPGVQTVVVGGGPALEAMKAALPQTCFTGSLHGEDLAEVYASADVFFFPSDTETFGNVTLEAMASGLPVVGADAAGNRSLVSHGVNGYLAPASDTSEYLRKIDAIKTDHALRSTMAAESRKLAESYDWSNVMQELMKQYKIVLKR